MDRARSRSSFIASPQCRSTFGARRERPPAPPPAHGRSRSRGRDAATRREPLGQHPFAGADLEHHVVRPELRVADDRVEQVGVGEEVLPEPDHRALPAEERPGVGLDRPLQLLVGYAAHLGDHLRGGDDVGGLVGLAAHRLRRQVGSVGLDQDELVGQLRRRLAQLLGAGEGDDAGEGAVPAALDRVLAPARARGSSAGSPARRRRCASRIAKTSSVAPVSPSGSRAWITIGRPCSRAISICASKARRCSARARRLAVVVDPGLADRPHLLVLGGEAGDLGRRARRRTRPPRSGGSRPSRRRPRGARPPAIAVGCLGVQADVEHPLDPGLARRARPARPRAARRGRGGCGSRSRLSLSRRVAARPIAFRPMADFADFYREIYGRGLGGETPAIPVAVAELERRPARRWTSGPRTTSSPAPAASDTMDANREALDRRRIVPRMLRDVAERDLSTTVLGTALPAPLLLAPIGVQKVVHDDGELATARAAAALGLPMIASTASHFTLEEIAEAGGDAPRWFQLYWPNDRALVESFVGRAEAAGYGAIVRHRRHLHPRLEAARPAAGLAALPRRHRQRQLLPGPGLPRRPRADRPRRTSAPPPATTSACSPTRRSPGTTWRGCAS